MSTIDLSQLPPPTIIEMPKFQDLKSQRLAELQGLDSDFDALLESDPAIKLLEILVYREMVNVARFNSGILAVLLAYAKGADLDQLGANFDVERLTVTPADDTTIPPTPAVMESDDEYRARIRLSWYARNTAGAVQAYEYFSLSADSSVLDAKAYGPPTTQPGYVDVYIINRTGDGTPDQALIDTVNAALSADFTRPLTDFVTVKAPAVIDYQITATLIISTGPDADTVVNAAKKAAQAYADSVHKIGVSVSIAGVYKALKQAGVDDVLLTVPSASVAIAYGEVSFCTAITLTVQQE